MSRIQTLPAVALLALFAVAPASATPALSGSRSPTPAVHVAPPPCAQGAEQQSSRSPWTANDIRTAQSALRIDQIYAGGIDGQMSSEVHAAIRQYQRVHKLPVTGELSKTVLAMLRADIVRSDTTTQW
jgi:peptidoglycan hydrolase-like protein with peptidoglycan-binding domain